MSGEAERRGFRVKLCGAAKVGRGGGGIYKVRPGKRAGPSWMAPPNGRHTRPAIAKAIIIDRSKGAGRNAIANAVKYAAKDGPLFERSAEGVREADPEKVADAWQYDRLAHHIVVAPNDGMKLPDPNAFAKATLENWERHTGPLQAVWSIEEKPDKAHPEGNRHFHFVIKGEQDGKDMEFTAAMIRRGFRDGAREAATDALGYMTMQECRDYDRQKEMARWERERERANKTDRSEERSL